MLFTYIDKKAEIGCAIAFQYKTCELTFLILFVIILHNPGKLNTGKHQTGTAIYTYKIIAQYKLYKKYKYDYPIIK